jgi:hypothetical protein
MSAYRESYATRQLSPPYIGRDGRLHGVFIEVAPAAVNQFCDITLNLQGRKNRRYEYRAIEQYSAAMVAVSEYVMSSQETATAPGASKLPSASEGSDHLTLRQAYIGVPVHRFTIRPDNMLTDPVVEWYYPLLLVDNTTTMFSYRETLGLDAIWGGIEVTPDTPGARKSTPRTRPRRPVASAGVPALSTSAPTEGPQSDPDFSLRVSVPMWKKFLPQSPQLQLPLFEMAMRGSGKIAIDTGNLAKIEQNVEEFQFIRDSLPQMYNLLTGATSVFPMISLKQFRDPGNTGQAAYQALMVADSSLEAIDRFFVYKPDAVTLSFENSVMVADILSTFLNLDPHHFIPDRRPRDEKASGTLHPKVALGFSLNMNSRIDNVRAIQTFYD